MLLRAPSLFITVLMAWLRNTEDIGQTILETFFLFFCFFGHRELSGSIFDPKIWGLIDISVLHVI